MLYNLFSVDPKAYLLNTLQESLSLKQKFVESHVDELIQSAKILAVTIERGGKIMILGNGGSAADSQHMAAEMVGRMLMERRPLPAMALTTDTSNITAVGNDYSFEDIFLKQVQAFAKSEDCLIAISTSGNSKNVLAAVREAKKRGTFVIGLTGGSGGALKAHCDISLCVEEGSNSSRIQESHIFAIHSLVDLLDRFFLDKVLPKDLSNHDQLSV